MNSIPGSPPKPSSRGAFSLIEVTLALGVAIFCLITVFALLPLGLTSNQASLEQTMAGNISSAIVADLRCVQPMSTGTSPRFGFSVPAAGQGTAITTPQTIYLDAAGTATGAVGTSPVITGTAVSRYRATLGFAPPPTGQRTATTVRLLITWPALADTAPTQWPANYTGSYEAATTLDRN